MPKAKAVMATAVLYNCYIKIKEESFRFLPLYLLDIFMISSKTIFMLSLVLGESFFILYCFTLRLKKQVRQGATQIEGDNVLSVR